MRRGLSSAPRSRTGEARATPRIPHSIVPAADLRVVREDDDFRVARGYRAGVTRALAAGRRFWLDALVVALGVAGVVENAVVPDAPNELTSPDLDRGADAAIVATLLMLVIGVLLRRRHPFGGPALGLATVVAASFVVPRYVPSSPVLFVLITIVAVLLGSGPDQRLAVVGGVALVGTAAVGTANDPTGGWEDFVFVTIVFGSAWVGGFVLRGRLTQAQIAAVEARRLADRQRAAAELAVTEERRRIASELHDVIAHSVSVMTVQAGAVRRLLKPEQVREREALETVEATGRQAMTEMRRLVGLLREQDAMPEFSPQPSLGALDTLIAAVRESGLPVEFVVEGDPRELPPGVDLSAYRVVQEALTAALEHSGTGHAWVTLRGLTGELELESANDGGTGEESNGGGQGLIGMNERVSLYGGTIESGPRQGGGFVVKARLPLEESR
jgi:signal transduction histidine kinase